MLLLLLVVMPVTGQPDIVKVKPGKTSGHFFASMHFNQPIKSVRVSGVNTSANGLDTATTFMASLKSDSLSIQSMWLHPYFMVWEDPSGRKHVAPYTSYLQKEQVSGKLFWLLQVATSDTTVLFRLRHKPETGLIAKSAQLRKRVVDSLGVDFNGELNVETEWGNQLYSQNAEKPFLIRAYGQNQLQLGQVPFRLRYGTSTEHSANHNLQYLAFEFDEDALMRNLQKKAMPIAHNRLDSLNAEALLEEQLVQGRSKVVAEIEQEQKALEDSLARWKQNQTQRVSDSAASLGKPYADSLNVRRDKLASKEQQARQQWQNLESKHDSLLLLQSKGEHIIDSVNSLQEQLNKTLNTLSGTGSTDIIQTIPNKLGLSRFSQKLTHLDHLKLGKHVLMPSSLIDPISVQGVSLGLRANNGSKIYLSRSRTHSSLEYSRFFSPLFSDQPVQKLWATGVEWPVQKNLKTHAHFLSASDTNSTSMRNSYLVLGGTWDASAFRVSADWVLNQHHLSSEMSPSIQQSSFAGNVSAEMDAFKKHLHFYTKYRRFDKGFQNIGYQRFMNGLAESSLGSRSSFLKGKMSFDVFYSYIKQEHELNTTSHRKWGGQAILRPAKGLEVSGGYFPVAQMVLPASGLPERQYLKTEVVNAQASVHRTYAKWQWYQSISLQQFSTHNTFQPSTEKQTSLSANFSCSSPFLGSIQYQYLWFSKTESAFSIPYASHLFSHSIPLSKQLTMGYNAAYQMAETGAVGRIGLSSDFNLKWFSAHLQMAYDVANTLPEVPSSPLYGQLRFTFRY